MKVTYTTDNGRITFEFEVQNRKVAFESIGLLQELFEEPQCGCCKSLKLRYSTRVHENRDGEKNKYFQILCGECGAQLDIGQRKDGGMWIKRTNKEGGKMPNNGWYKYEKSSGGSGGGGGSTSGSDNGGGYDNSGGDSGSEIPF